MRMIGVALALGVQLQSSLEAQTIKFAPDRLRSVHDTVRMAAFYDMARAANEHDRYPEAPPTSFLAGRAARQPSLAAALIDLLQRENAVVAGTPRGSLSEDYFGGYYVDLLVTVARMHDPRSLGALLPGLGISGVVCTTVAGFGEPAAGPVARAIGSTNRDERIGAAITMGLLLAGRMRTPLSEGALGTLRDTLLGVSARPAEDAFVRTLAVEALMPLSDDEIRAQMERIATTDTATGHRPDQPVTYPVKAAAQKWLAKHP